MPDLPRLRSLRTLFLQIFSLPFQRRPHHIFSSNQYIRILPECKCNWKRYRQFLDHWRATRRVNEMLGMCLEDHPSTTG